MHCSVNCVALAYERAVRDQQKRAEVSQAKRENKHYLANVDKGKEISAILERKRKRGVATRDVSRRHYKQRLVQEKGEEEEEEKEDEKQEKDGIFEHADKGSKRHLSDSLLRKVCAIKTM